MLSCYRVLDLTDDKGYFCGKALGDLGADVIKVEPPGGDPGRKRGPFYHDIPDPEKSLYWFAFNTSKRGITLDIEKAEGRQLFKELVKTADVVLESFSPGYMDKLGLGYPALREVNEGVIMTAITPFGQEGPYKDFKGPDIVASALGGTLYTVGDPGRPPLTATYPHAYTVCSMHAVVGTLIALFHRSVIGRGQYVDASAQIALHFTGSAEIEGSWEFHGITQRRHGRKRFAIRIKDDKNAFTPILWSCKDGNIGLNIQLGPSGEKGNTALVEWMKSEGHDIGRLGQWDFKTMDWSVLESQEESDEIHDVLQSFFLKFTKEELFKKSAEIGLKMGISLTPKDMMTFPQLVQRGFFTEVDYPELGTTLTHPGSPTRFSDGAHGIKRRAPLIGEHNVEVYQELGLPVAELAVLKERGVI
jgi:benzylsuccinate CoA-transferase BbsE subunit